MPCTGEERPKPVVFVAQDGNPLQATVGEGTAVPQADPPQVEVQIDHEAVLQKTTIEHKAAEKNRRVTLKVYQLYIEAKILAPTLTLILTLIRILIRILILILILIPLLLLTPDPADSQKLCEKNAHTAAQIRSMDLDPISEDEVAYTILKIDEMTDRGESYASYGQVIFFVQAVTAALVPVLIGIMGSMGSEKLDDYLRLITIILSILGTIAKAVQEVFAFRARGQLITEACSGLGDLFHRYVALAGPVFDPRGNPSHPLAEGSWGGSKNVNPHQVMFQTYIDVFNEDVPLSLSLLSLSLTSTGGAQP